MAYLLKMRAKKRNYKEEYRKFGKGGIANRVELNKINREAGTYGNGDGLDVSHKPDGSTTMESEGANRGRKEKSRLKGSKRKPR